MQLTLCFVFCLFVCFKKFIYLFIYFWLCWVFVSVQGVSLVAASGGHSSSRCTGLSLSRPLLLRSTGTRCAGSTIVAHGPSCSAACGILPDQDSNLCPLHWQADSQPLRHQGSPLPSFLHSSALHPATLQSPLPHHPAHQRCECYHADTPRAGPPPPPPLQETLVRRGGSPQTPTQAQPSPTGRPPGPPTLQV